MTLAELLTPALRQRYRTHWAATIAHLKDAGFSDSEIARELATPLCADPAFWGGIRPAARALMVNKDALHRRLNETARATNNAMTKTQSDELIAAAHEKNVLLKEQNEIHAEILGVLKQILEIHHEQTSKDSE